MIKAVIFDMDGVLIDSEPLWHEAEIETFATVNIRLNEQKCLESTGLRIDEVVKYWYEQFPWKSPGPQTIEERIIRRVIELIHQKGLPKKGISHALEFFKKQQIPIALASSSRYSIIQAVLEKLQITQQFQFVYSAEEETFGKPHPGVYIQTAKKLNVSPKHCLAIEDSFRGILSAKSAQMKCIAIPEEWSKQDERFVIADKKLNSLLEINEEFWEQVNLLS